MPSAPACSCQLCYAFIYDHLETSAHVTLPRPHHILPHLPFLASELCYQFDKYLKRIDHYKILVDNCETYKIFCGREKMLDMLYRSQLPISAAVLYMCDVLQDKAGGAAKPAILEDWLKDECYTLFSVFMKYHAEHTNTLEVDALGPPLLYKSHGKVVFAASAKAPRISLGEEDLYA